MKKRLCKKLKRSPKPRQSLPTERRAPPRPVSKIGNRSPERRASLGSKRRKTKATLCRPGAPTGRPRHLGSNHRKATTTLGPPATLDMHRGRTALEIRLSGDIRRVNVPLRSSFEEFLLHDARVPCGHGLHGPLSFTGREALLPIVRLIDQILGNAPTSEFRPPSSVLRSPPTALRPPTSVLSDAELCLAGGAQFGKTILELNLAAYITSQSFRNFGLYLPDDDLVEGIVDSKFRPDVVDQIGWFAEMVQVGKALNKSGKAVNRKGAFLVTDGLRKSVGMIRGLGKVPTTFSMDAAAMDEVDDIQPKMMKFVRGRLTASDLRFILKIGTQRIHGRGMNKAWKDGSQGVFAFVCPACGRTHNPEEEFPQIVRYVVPPLGGPGARANVGGPDKSGTTNPKLTWAGDFKLDGDDTASFAHDPLNQYYLGCVSCGAELDRTKPIEEHRQPAMITQRKWSFRISQLAIAAIDLSQIVARFQSAVADPEDMVVFRCDVLALPQSTSQALTPAILDRARSVEIFDLPPRAREGSVAFGGLDMGDRCWLFARETINSGNSQLPTRRLKPSTSPMPLGYLALPGSPIPNPPSTLNSQLSTRLLAANRISAGDVVARAVARFEQARPLRPVH